MRSKLFGEFSATTKFVTTVSADTDVLFLAVKNKDLKKVTAGFESLAKNGCLIVPLLNGLEHVDEIREQYPAIKMASAAIRVESTRTEPGVFEHGSPFMSIEFASDDVPEPELNPLVELLTGAGVDVKVSASSLEVLWRKLAFLAPFALLTTSKQASIGQVLTDWPDELNAVTREVGDVARRVTGRDMVSDALAAYQSFPAESKSSMLRDFERGDVLELDAIGGAVIRAGRRFSLTMPATTAVVAEIEQLPGVML